MGGSGFHHFEVTRRAVLLSRGQLSTLISFLRNLERGKTQQDEVPFNEGSDKSNTGDNASNGGPDGEDAPPSGTDPVGAGAGLAGSLVLNLQELKSLLATLPDSIPGSPKHKSKHPVTHQDNSTNKSHNSTSASAGGEGSGGGASLTGDLVSHSEPELVMVIPLGDASGSSEAPGFLNEEQVINNSR